jgi:hypothetical protein
LINEKCLDQVNDIIIYWEGGVSPALRETEETRKNICGISYRFDDGIYYIGRIKERNSDEIKFLYAFTTEVPSYPISQSNEVSRRMINIAQEVGLNFSSEASPLIPVVYFLEDRIDFEKYRNLESKVREFKNRIDIPLYNSRRSLRVDPFTGQFRNR